MVQTLREMRHNSPYPIERIATHMNVTPRAINLWETGKRPISAMNLYKLITFYQTDGRLSDIKDLFSSTKKGEIQTNRGEVPK